MLLLLPVAVMLMGVLMLAGLLRIIRARCRKCMLAAYTAWRMCCASAGAACVMRAFWRYVAQLRVATVPRHCAAPLQASVCDSMAAVHVVHVRCVIVATSRVVYVQAVNQPLKVESEKSGKGGDHHGPRKVWPAQAWVL